jgi:EmrB/QacA subfamily drug resistance transporter
MPLVRPAAAAARRSAFALATACIGCFMILLDGSAVNIVLPAIQHDVHGSIAGLQWVVTVYTIPLASVLLTSGDLGDRFGVRRLFVWSLGAFTAASVWCALSPSLPVLLVARAVQGVAAGGVLPMTLAILAHEYRDPTARAKAITLWGSAGAVALIVGPSGGGLLTAGFGWRSVFLINVPTGLTALLIALRHLRTDTERRSKPHDLVGQALGVLALAGLVAGLIGGGSNGWTAPGTVVLLVAGVACAAAFGMVERRVAHPVLPPEMFRGHAFTAAVLSGFGYQFGSFGMQFMLAIYLQDAWHVDTARAGVLFLPFSLCSLVGVLVLNRGLIRRGSRWLLCVGAVIAVLGAVVVLGMPSGPDGWPVFVVGTALVGLGSGMFAPSINAVALGSVDATFAGLGSGVLNTSRQIGMAVGVGLLGGFIALADPALGMRVGMGCVAGCFVAILVLAIRFVPAHG